MIIASLLGGPHDGRVIALPELAPLVFPVISDGLFGDIGPEVMSTVTYFPREDSLQLCDCCAESRARWEHAAVKLSIDLTNITYARHFVCTYTLPGFK